MRVNRLRCLLAQAPPPPPPEGFRRAGVVVGRRPLRKRPLESEGISSFGFYVLPGEGVPALRLNLVEVYIAPMGELLLARGAPRPDGVAFPLEGV
ncbi:MAG: hypothetical protein ACUVQC_03425, partial [Thermaceae bacterium]